VTVLLVAVATVPIAWNAGSATLLVVTLGAGTLIYSAIWVVTASLSFWTVETEEVASSFTFGGSYITQYPLDVLTTWLRRLLVVIPLAFVNYVPACRILGKPDATGLPAWAAFASPFVALVCVAAARLVWAAGIRHYRSTGS
jgi:ABC-2 type transport system permease protein